MFFMFNKDLNLDQFNKTKEIRMEKFIGTKLVSGMPMSRGAYNDYRGWELPSDEDGSDVGYLVEYLDGGKPNHPHHKGYISWSPKEQFDNSYRKTDGMNFGLATEAAKKGLKVARAGWNGAGMLAYIVPKRSLVASELSAHIDLGDRMPACDDGVIDAREHWELFTAQKDIAMWAPSGSDSLADDWMIVE